MLEVDIWRAANIIIEQKRDRAIEHADKMATDALKQGDKAGHLVWREIGKAMDRLLKYTQDGDAH